MRKKTKREENLSYLYPPPSPVNPVILDDTVSARATQSGAGMGQQGPFTDVVTADLKLTNPTDKRIYFKVKTTAPKCYCVRPNTGILEPKETATVAVMLQPFEHEPSGKATLKFMVLSMYAPEGRIESQDQLWKDAPPDSVMDTKLICVFDMPESVPLPPSYQDIDCMQDDKSSVGSGSDEVERLREEVKRLTARVNSLRAENLRLKADGAQ